MKKSKQLVGISGEYFVAAELSRRGYLAAITLRNSDGVDILVSNLEGNKLLSIQVKTTENKLNWILTKKVENEKSENKYFVFVSIPEDSNKQPKYFIVHSNVLSEHIYKAHRAWLAQPGRGGKKRNDSDVRRFDPRYFKDSELLSWDDFIEILKESDGSIR